MGDSADVEVVSLDDGVDSGAVESVVELSKVDVDVSGMDIESDGVDLGEGMTPFVLLSPGMSLMSRIVERVRPCGLSSERHR